jgi:hypothetical protein
MTQIKQKRSPGFMPSVLIRVIRAIRGPLFFILRAGKKQKAPAVESAGAFFRSFGCVPTQSVGHV